MKLLLLDVLGWGSLLGGFVVLAYVDQPWQLTGLLGVIAGAALLVPSWPRRG